MRKSGFEDWRITVEVSNDRPLRSGRSRRCGACSSIAGCKLQARDVRFEACDYYVGSIDMSDALHPQTILAYGMNGRELPLGNRAPLRLPVERPIGYKSVRYLRKILVTDDFDDQAGCSIPAGWAWYTGI